MTCGLILGKFLPPHRGHQYLVEFASRMVERINSAGLHHVASEPISGAFEMIPMDAVIFWRRERGPQ